MGQQSHFIEHARTRAKSSCKRARIRIACDSITAPRGKNFVRSDFFCKNVLHYFDKCVQLLASDIGFRAHQLATINTRTFESLRSEVRVTGATGER